MTLNSIHNTLDIITHFLKMLGLATLIAIGVMGWVVLNDVHTGKILKPVTSLVDTHLTKTENQLFAKYDKIEQDLFTRYDATEKNLFGVLNIAVDKTDKQTTKALDIVAQTSTSLLNPKDGVIASLNKEFAAVNDQLYQFNTTVAVTTQPMQLAAKQINDALPDFLDCQVTDDGVGNKNCLYVRYGDLSSSLDRSLSAITKATPDMVANADKIAASSAEVAKQAGIAATNFNKPQTVLQKFQMWLIVAGKLAGAFL